MKIIFKKASEFRSLFAFTNLLVFTIKESENKNVINNYKAENAGKRVWKVDARNTSQICSGCGETVKKSLAMRVHKCQNCGIELHRDTNAAKNILVRAEPLLMSSVATADEARI